MAPRRNFSRNNHNNARNAKRNASNKKNKAKRRTPTALGGYIASGIRTLTSFLPGQQVVRPAVDFILKAIGLVSAISLHNENLVAKTQIIGLTTRKILYYGDLLSDCKNIGLQDLDAYGNPTLKLNFLTGRVLSITIRVEPTAKTSERSGEWAMCLVPLKDAAIKQKYSALFPQYEEIKNMPFSRSGLATKTLTFTWNPKFPRDGIAAMERDLLSKDPVCYLYLAYSQECRDAYGQFPSDTFNCRVTINTRCQLGERIINSAFTAGGNSITLKCDTSVPSSMYMMKYKDKLIEKKHPIILDGKHHLAKLLFRYEHTRQMHAGPQALLYSIRETIWPIGGRLLARRTVRDCVTCRRHQGQTLTPMMGSLPAQRVTPGFPFQSVGIDFAGPYSILNRKGRGAKTSKGYLCLFICFRYKCVHLEAVSDLTKDALILAMRRMISRRGKPREFFSDNGRNLVAAAREITEFLKTNNVISEFAVQEQIKFHFIPAYAAHFGGLWEAGIKSAKHHLKRYMGKNNFTFEEITTLFTQVEAILNSRPLYPMSSSPDDFLPLSPGHFLIGRPLTALPSPNLEDVNSSSLERYSRLEKVRQQFWRRWQREYISELQQRTKWRTNRDKLRVGDLVLLQEDNVAPLNWRLGRVISLHPGADGVSRVADIKTARGLVRRTLTRLCPLFNSNESDT